MEPHQTRFQRSRSVSTCGCDCLGMYWSCNVATINRTILVMVISAYSLWASAAEIWALSDLHTRSTQRVRIISVDAHSVWIVIAATRAARELSNVYRKSWLYLNCAYLYKPWRYLRNRPDYFYRV